MASVVDRLCRKQLINPPAFLRDCVHYEVMMGSVAYGVSSNKSDVDVYGICIPPKEIIFPHLAGYIHGFGRQRKEFFQYQQHHVQDKDANKEYDLSIYNIVKAFQLCMENNPNMIDMLFVPQFCILHTTRIGNMIRENRKLFLHKGCWYKFKGYAFSQLHKMRTKNPEGKRKETIEKYSYDVKFAYHVVRLLDECEQILTFGDLDLTRNREQMKAIRRGEVPEQSIYDYFNEKEKSLEKLYHESKLRYSPDEPAIKQLLLDCLEEHYGDLSSCVVNPDAAVVALRQIAEIIENNKKILGG